MIPLNVIDPLYRWATGETWSQRRERELEAQAKVLREALADPSRAFKDAREVDARLQNALLDLRLLGLGEVETKLEEALVRCKGCGLRLTEGHALLCEDGLDYYCAGCVGNAGMASCWACQEEFLLTRLESHLAECGAWCECCGKAPNKRGPRPTGLCAACQTNG